ncbi:MAG: hypothetical protein MJZ50_03540 [Treponema sp.]|nr:hypothetical protein [Treponema sp.]
MDFKRLSDEVKILIHNHCGIILSTAHEMHVESFLKNRVEELETNNASYLNMLNEKPQELDLLINEACINETYFFREERSFDALASNFLSEIKERNLLVWSAACSTGEEAISLLAFLENAGRRVSITASDIDSSALEKFKAGKYGHNSLRSDGAKYHGLLNSYGKLEAGGFTASDSVYEKISIKKINLMNTASYPFITESLDFIFVKNVFIYFSEDSRKKILKAMWSILKDSGYIFLSISEIAGIDCPELFQKVSYKDVYALKKIPRFASESKRNAVDVTEEKKLSGEEQSLIQQAAEQTRATMKQDSENAPVFRREIYDFVDRINALLDKGWYDDCIKLIDGFTFHGHEAEFGLFYRGFIHYRKEEYDKADEYFAKANLLNGKFWPSVLMRGYSSWKTGRIKEATALFYAGIDLLKESANNRKLWYNFMAKEFSTEYFIELCEKMVLMLEKRTN